MKLRVISNVLRGKGKGRVKAYRVLLGELATFKDRVRFSIIVIINFLFPVLFRKVPVIMEMRFKRFYLKYRVGQTELSPYLEIKEGFAKGVFPEPGEVQDWTILDCGANIGLFALFFKGAKRIIAVEPNPGCQARLRHNLSKNGVRFSIVRKAVSSEEGHVKMALNDTNTTEALVAEDGNFLVEATTIDRIIEECGIERVDLLKLDLEGHEIPALRGAVNSCKQGIIKRIYAEFRSDHLLDELDSFLIPLKYRRVAIIHWYNAYYELCSNVAC